MRSHEGASRQPGPFHFDPVKNLNVTLNPNLGCLPVADKNHFKTRRERVNLAA